MKKMLARIRKSNAKRSELVQKTCQQIKKAFPVDQLNPTTKINRKYMVYDEDFSIGYCQIPKVTRDNKQTY